MNGEREERGLEELGERIDRQRHEADVSEGNAAEPRFSDDGRIDEGAGSDASAPPG